MTFELQFGVELGVKFWKKQLSGDEEHELGQGK